MTAMTDSSLHLGMKISCPPSWRQSIDESHRRCRLPGHPNLCVDQAFRRERNDSRCALRLIVIISQEAHGSPELRGDLACVDTKKERLARSAYCHSKTGIVPLTAVTFQGAASFQRQQNMKGCASPRKANPVKQPGTSSAKSSFVPSEEEPIYGSKTAPHNVDLCCQFGVCAVNNRKL